jgi:hypothetical protein
MKILIIITVLMLFSCDYAQTQNTYIYHKTIIQDNRTRAERMIDRSYAQINRSQMRIERYLNSILNYNKQPTYNKRYSHTYNKRHTYKQYRHRTKRYNRRCVYKTKRHSRW